MWRAFCFSLSWLAYSDSFRRRWPWAPGGTFRRSIAHFGPKQRSPFKNNLSPCRRQIRQTGPVYRAIGAPARLNPALLRWSATVVRDRRHVDDRTNPEAGRLERTDRRLTAGSRPLDVDADLAHPVLHRLARGRLARQAGGVRSAL